MPNRTIAMPSFDLTGKTAIVTGGTKGLGFGIASTLAHFGANVVLTSRHGSEGAEVAADINANYITGSNRCVAVEADSGKPEDIAKTIATAVSEFGALNIMVNNAGVSGPTAKIVENREGRKEYTQSDFEKVLATNLEGVFLFCQAAARQMIAQKTGGKIINIASVGGLVGGPGVVAYGASKAGVISMTKTMANEFGKDGINVVAVCPGYVVTPLNSNVMLDENGQHTQVYELSAKNTAVRRLGEIEEIAGPVCALCSDCFSYMTGTTVVIDGGQTIGR